VNMFELIAKLRREPSVDLWKTGQAVHRSEERAMLADSQDWAFTVLLQRYRASVVHFLYRMMQDRVVAEDLAVEVFLRHYRSAVAGSDSAAQSATRLFRIATDLALQEIHRNRPPQRELDRAFEDAGRAVASMPAKQRAAVLMHKYHRMDYRQIAKVLDCTDSAARSLLLSAYDLLRQRFVACQVQQN
jgi:RNA polymerase sigma-70 factor (ECF subfamily)